MTGLNILSQFSPRDLVDHAGLSLETLFLRPPITSSMAPEPCFQSSCLSHASTGNIQNITTDAMEEMHIECGNGT